jgi:hypothetical protein
MRSWETRNHLTASKSRTNATAVSSVLFINWIFLNLAQVSLKSCGSGPHREKLLVACSQGVLSPSGVEDGANEDPYGEAVRSCLPSQRVYLQGRGIL